jgi:hypothetical protein
LKQAENKEVNIYTRGREGKGEKIYLLVGVVVLLLDGLVAGATDAHHPQELVDVVRGIACEKSASHSP